jgi:hypothetical protein
MAYFISFLKCRKTDFDTPKLNALKSEFWRESATARLEEAVAALREALKEQARNRVPLRWAHTQTHSAPLS